MASTMEEMTLIDAENNIEFKVAVSSDDAMKARNDHEFAYSLLQLAKRNIKIAKRNVNMDKRVLSETEGVDDLDAVASCSSQSDPNLETKDQHVWTRSETMLLINLYKEHINEFNNPKISAKQCWNIISKEMKDAGYLIAPIKCSTKLQCLKRTYKSVSDHNKKSGNSRKHWEYYEIMHDVFGTKPWVEPQATAGSNDIKNSDAENEDPKVPKKRKINHIVEGYLEKSIRFKEEKERNAQKRHEEKMSYLAKIENLMTKTFEKDA